MTSLDILLARLVLCYDSLKTQSYAAPIDNVSCSERTPHDRVSYDANYKIWANEIRWRD